MDKDHAFLELYYYFLFYLKLLHAMESQIHQFPHSYKSALTQLVNHILFYYNRFVVFYDSPIPNKVQLFLHMKVKDMF